MTGEEIVRESGIKRRSSYFLREVVFLFTE